MKTRKQKSKIVLQLSTSLVVLSFLPLPTLAVTSLSVPFTSQAPLSDWKEPWQNACEETAILMVDSFYTSRSLADKYKARDEILRIFEIKQTSFGPSLDENADKIVKLINNFLPWEARVVENPTLEDLKSEIDAGRPIILPASGGELENPHFRSHPNYHTIVLSGYDDEKKEFITREPGTRYGLDFRYSYDRILDAMHDFVPHGKTPTGRKVAIFTSPQLEKTKDIDADNDGLTKEEEKNNGTKTWQKDTDKDGFSDGEEIKNGYSPLVAEKSLRTGMLVKAPNNPQVYLIESGKKRHIVSEQVFDRHGWKSGQIILLSSKYLASIPEDTPIEK